MSTIAFCTFITDNGNLQLITSTSIHFVLSCHNTSNTCSIFIWHIPVVALIVIVQNLANRFTLHKESNLKPD